MHSTQRSGFTLLEVLIVVVLLGILAAIVVPQMAGASDEAKKSTLKRQLQLISTSIEVYRGQNFGLFPTDDLSSPMEEGGANDGWGVLVSDLYLKKTPLNTYTGEVTLLAGDVADATGETRSSSAGWYFDDLGPTLEVFASAYDPETDLLAHEFEGD